MSRKHVVNCRCGGYNRTICNARGQCLPSIKKQKEDSFSMLPPNLIALRNHHDASIFWFGHFSDDDRQQTITVFVGTQYMVCVATHSEN